MTQTLTQTGPMADTDNFLWEIQENPGDDAPRLVFADWLEEHGEPAHADFIRVQCELAGQREEDERWLARKIREEELWDVLRQRWRGAVGQLGRGGFRLSDFWRGFVYPTQTFRIDAEAFARAAGGWPFLLEFGMSVGGCSVPGVFANPAMRRVTTLDCQRSGVDDDTLAPVADSPYFGRLKQLDLWRNAVGPVGIRALATCPSLTELTQLDLGENQIGDAGLTALVNSGVCRTLRQLRLNENGLTDAGVIALADSPNLEALELLWLYNNRLTSAAVDALASSRRLPRLTTLHVGESSAYNLRSPGFVDLRTRLGDGFTIENNSEE